MGSTFLPKLTKALLAPLSGSEAVTLNNASDYYWTISDGLTDFRANGLGLRLGVR